MAVVCGQGSFWESPPIAGDCLLPLVPVDRLEVVPRWWCSRAWFGYRWWFLVVVVVFRYFDGSAYVGRRVEQRIPSNAAVVSP